MCVCVCALKYFLNADFSLKIISITPSAATAGAAAGAAVVSADAAPAAAAAVLLFCRLWQLLPPFQLSLSQSLLSSADRDLFKLQVD